MCTAEGLCFNHIHKIHGDVFKIATNIQATTIQEIKPTQEINDLTVCFLAHLRQLQEHFTSVLVTGKFGDNTQGIFSTITEYKCAHALCD